TARGWRGARGVYVTLQLARDMVGACVPDEVLRDLRPAVVDRDLLRIAANRVVTPSEPAVIGSSYLTRFVFDDRQDSRLRLVFSRLFVPRLEIAGMYGVPHDSSRIYLCYLRRWWDLMTRYWRVWLDLSRGRRDELMDANQAARLAHWIVSSD